MRKYRKEDPSIVQPAETQARPKLSSYAKTSTHFQLKDHPIYPGHSGQEPMGGVEDEFKIYTSSPLTPESTDILVYWQVSPMRTQPLNAITPHTTDRLTSLNFPHSSLLPWTSFPSKHLLSRANVSSHQLRRPIPRNEIASAQP